MQIYMFLKMYSELNISNCFTDGGVSTSSPSGYDGIRDE